jgi:hypothetical protein
MWGINILVITSEETLKFGTFEDDLSADIVLVHNGFSGDDLSHFTPTGIESIFLLYEKKEL